MSAPTIYYTDGIPVATDSYDTGNIQGWTNHVNTSSQTWEEFTTLPTWRQVETAMRICSTWGDADWDTPPTALEKEGMQLFDRRARMEGQPKFNGYNFPKDFVADAISWLKRYLTSVQA